MGCRNFGRSDGDFLRFDRRVTHSALNFINIGLIRHDMKRARAARIEPPGSAGACDWVSQLVGDAGLAASDLGFTRDRHHTMRTSATADVRWRPGMTGQVWERDENCAVTPRCIM
jgi:hypothetical protein